MEYETLDGRMTLAYPSTWVKVGELSSYVFLESANLSLNLEFLVGEGRDFGDDDTKNIDIVATELANNMPPLDPFSAKEKGLWRHPILRGWYIVGCLYATVVSGEVPTAVCAIYLKAGDDCVRLCMVRPWSEEFEPSQLDTLRAICDTIRVKRV